MIRYTPPILTSLLDTDAYKLHMQQAIFHSYHDVTVAVEFCCRSNELLGCYVDEIREAINAMQNLALTNDEYTWLSRLPIFVKDYLNWLRDFRYKPQQVKMQNHHGRLNLRIQGKWLEVILWEVPLLALISEVVHRHRTPKITPQYATDYLHKKLVHFEHQVANLDMSNFCLIDFGTRRRYSQKVHQAIVTTLKQYFPWFMGTSNYDLARRFALTPVGTQAHEWFQAFQQISPVLANSQRDALQAWLNEYDDKLGIALTDCIAMDAFLRDFGLLFARRYQGLRHDSGDPVEWGEKAIAHYQKLGIDSKKKTLVFSDNLNLDKALALYRHFGERVNVVCGIGTRLSCDIPSVTPLNIVIKLVQCNDKPVAKLSDSPDKVICQDKDFVKTLCQAFDLPVPLVNKPTKQLYQDVKKLYFPNN